VSLMARPLYPWEESSLNPLHRKLSGPQNLSNRHGKLKILDPTRNQTRLLYSPTRSLVIIPNELSSFLEVYICYVLIFFSE
jgi:hypothetical protein